MTRFTDLVGCSRPIQLAAMGVVGTADLAAAVSDAGGLGMVPGGDVEEAIANIRRRTDAPFGVNFLVPFVYRPAVEAASGRVPVIEFFYGEPDADLIAGAKRGGSVVGWQVGSRTEAVAAVTAGCDYVIVQGIEAGGHVSGNKPLHELLLETTDLDVPIVAAGGIGTAADVVAALRAGASAVRVGTRFLAAEESAAHPDYTDALISARADDTVLTRAFGVGWPDAPHRVLRSALEAAEALDRDVVATIGRAEIPRFSVVPPTRDVVGAIGAMALYAGRSVEAVTKIQPAAEIVSELLPEDA